MTQIGLLMDDFELLDGEKLASNRDAPFPEDKPNTCFEIFQEQLNAHGLDMLLTHGSLYRQGGNLDGAWTFDGRLWHRHSKVSAASFLDKVVYGREHLKKTLYKDLSDSSIRVAPNVFLTDLLSNKFSQIEFLRGIIDFPPFRFFPHFERLEQVDFVKAVYSLSSSVAHDPKYLANWIFVKKAVGNGGSDVTPMIIGRDPLIKPDYMGEVLVQVGINNIYGDTDVNPKITMSHDLRLGFLHLGGEISEKPIFQSFYRFHNPEDPNFDSRHNQSQGGTVLYNNLQSLTGEHLDLILELLKRIRNSFGDGPALGSLDIARSDVPTSLNRSYMGIETNPNMGQIANVDDPMDRAGTTDISKGYAAIMCRVVNGNCAHTTTQ